MGRGASPPPPRSCSESTATASANSGTWWDTGHRLCDFLPFFDRPHPRSAAILPSYPVGKNGFGHRFGTAFGRATIGPYSHCASMKDKKVISQRATCCDFFFDFWRFLTPLPTRITLSFLGIWGRGWYRKTRTEGLYKFLTTTGRWRHLAGHAETTLRFSADFRSTPPSGNRSWP